MQSTGNMIKMNSRFIQFCSYLKYVLLLLLLLIVTGCEPRVTIKSPQHGESFEAGQAIPFSGSARTFWGGTITGDSLAWRSNIDGEIGTGENVITSTLSVGTHIITLSAANTSGEIGTETISLLVMK